MLIVIIEHILTLNDSTIDENYNFSTDNPLFVSNVFTLNVQANFLTGTSTAWGLTPAAQNYFDQLIALVNKVQSDLDSGAFNGNGIQSIEKISTSGLVDTYRITFTNGSTFEYEVTNGEMPVITIQNGNWYVNGVDTGQQAQGQTGVGIESIEKTSTQGNVDTYTITFTNQTTTTFTVTNGTNGATPNLQIGTVTTLQPDQQATASITGTPENPLLNFGIPQGQTGQGSNNNKLIGTVEKSENPTLSDSFESDITNLILYGKSTQGDNPSPTNKQEVTNINEISGNVNNVINEQPFLFTPLQPLYSTLDGSVYDAVDVESGYYIYNLGVKVIDENSNPASYGNGSSSLGYGFYVNLKEMKSGNALDGICNIAFVGAINPFPDKPTVTLGQGNTYAYFTKIFDSQKTVQEIKDWLQSNPITVVYQLATPVTQAIPAETLQQLQALHTYTGVTNFICNAPVSFQYEQSLQIVIQNIWNAINQTNANLLLTGGN